jgi:hypothetical protein
MKWEAIKDYKSPVFKRLTGVSKDTFITMVSEAVRLRPASAHKVKGLMRGPKAKLIIEDKLLMLLMYYREYRTFLHISSDYGISEAQCWRIITGLERILIKSELFHLPGKKVLQQANSFEIVLVDVAESPIERPKKNSENITLAKRKNTP